MTCAAEPVGRYSGNWVAGAVFAAGLAGSVLEAGRVECARGLRLEVGERLELGAGLAVAVGAGRDGVVLVLEAVLVLGAGVLTALRRGVGLLEQAAAASATATNATPNRREPIRPACHNVPMRIRGCADGVSQRISETSFVCGIEMQPAVAEPSVTCRKNALPAPWRTPPGALRVL